MPRRRLQETLRRVTRAHENTRQMFRDTQNLSLKWSRDPPSSIGGCSGTTNISIKISRSTERHRPTPSDRPETGQRESCGPAGHKNVFPVERLGDGAGPASEAGGGGSDVGCR